MIALSHFSNGRRIGLNAELIERVEETPDTVVTLTTGARYVVLESLNEIIELWARDQAHVIALAHRMAATPDGVAYDTAPVDDLGEVAHLRLVRGTVADGDREAGD